jgi:Tol biopolymer transport system component
LPAAFRACLLIVAASLIFCLTTPARLTVAASAPLASPAVVVAATAAPPPLARRRVNGKIAYVSNDDIWVMNPDGSNPTNLTPNTPQAAAASPAWSPDGAKLIFTRLDSGSAEPELVVMNADGSNQIILPIVAARFPAWSPDGTKLAYSARRNNVSDIYVANADGSGETNLTNTPAPDASPTWSPDGAQIAYVSGERQSAASTGLYIMDANGGNQRKILDQTVVIGIGAPKWSPDGARIMFEGEPYRNGPVNQAYLIAPDGNNFTRLNGSARYDPAWSPDGKKIVFRTHDELSADIGVSNLDGTDFFRFSPNTRIIDSQPAWQPLIGSENKIVFTSDRDGNAEIYLMESDGSNQTNLTNHPSKDATPVWSPDGARIAFTSDRSGRSNIYVMDADGGNVRAVTNFDNSASDYRVYDPAWSPDGTKLVFVGSAMGETSGLVVVNADGSGTRRPILEGSTEVADPAWSPDGTRIAYVGREPSPNAEAGVRFLLFVINADGTGKTCVAHNPLPFNSFSYPPQASGPTWTPGGQALIYTSTAFPNVVTTFPQLSSVSASGSLHPLVISSNPWANTHASQTTDRNRVVFTTNRDGQREIYVRLIGFGIPEDNTLTRLTQNQSDDYDPDWQPDPPIPQRAITTVQWSNVLYRVREDGQGGDAFVVTRLGDLTQASTVEYETREVPPCGDNSASCERGRATERSDYIRTTGALHFAPGEARKTISVPLIDDAYVEGDHVFTLQLMNATGVIAGVLSTAYVTITDNDTAETTPDTRPNPIDEPNFFVRMHYLDFLGREPEPAGQEAWVGVWNRCPDINRDETCDRITISSAFFRSQEFQMRGYFVYRFYRVSFNRKPTYAEFVRDMARISGQTLAEIDASKDAFALAWVQRADFRAAYLGTTAADYVARLEANTGVTLTGDVTRASLEADLVAGRRSIPGVLRAVVEHPNVEAAEYNGAFVTMQYFGYLKRDPEEEGFQNWMRVINRGDGYRVMVHGFVNSVEYRARFGRQ